MDVPQDEHRADPLVSVIISAYNAAQTIERAVASVLGQSHSTFEVIVIDDGSTDETRELVQALSEADDRVKLLDPRPNAGVSTSRNRGLDAASGEWISFLDADDEYAPQRLATMLAAATQQRLIDQLATDPTSTAQPSTEQPSTAQLAAEPTDAVCCQHTIVLPDGTKRVRGSAADGTMSGEQAAVAALSDRITPFVWDKMFRAEALAEVRFATDVHRGEDTIFVVEALANCRSVQMVDDPLNVYYVSSGSLTWGRVPPLSESDAAAARFTEVAERLGEQAAAALPTTKVITYLNSANLAAKRLPAEQAAQFMQQARSRFSWGEAITALRARPMVGAAGILLKLAPRSYSKLYASYAKRSYGVG